MAKKPTVTIALLGGDERVHDFLADCKNIYPLKPKTIESDQRIYEMMDCGLLCGSLSTVPFEAKSPAIGAIWFVSRKMKGSSIFEGHADAWLLFMLKQYQLAPVVYWSNPANESLADQQEQALREQLFTAGFEGNEVTILRENGDKRQEISVLLQNLDEIPNRPPTPKKAKEFNKSRAMIFIQPSEKTPLEPGRAVALKFTHKSKLYRNAVLYPEKTLQPGECGLARVDFETKWKGKPGAHFNFLSTSNLPAGHRESFGYLF